MKKSKQCEPWSRKTWKTIALTLMGLIGATALVMLGLWIADEVRARQYYDTGCDPFGGDYEYYTGLTEITTTKPGSWDSINQEVASAGDWRRIVRDSSFKEAYPFIDGSTTMVPLAMEFARQHLGLGDEDAKKYADFSTTSAAYEKLFTRAMVDLFIGTMPGSEELALAARNGITPVVKPICWDSFVFITHKDNPVDSLTVEQLRGIFSGEISNWKALGGEDAAIRAYQREPGAGSQTGMEKLVMQGTPMASPNTVEVITSMGALVEAVANRRNRTGQLGSYGIGYTYSYYIENLYKNADIKTLRIDGIAPTQANVVSGAYPLGMERYGVIRQGEEQTAAGLFLDWILSEEGQACVKQAGYIPILNS